MNINWKNIRLVRMDDKFSIRKGWVFHSYLDLKSYGHWWDKQSSFLCDCLSTDEELIRKIYYRIRGLDEVTLL